MAMSPQVAEILAAADAEGVDSRAALVSFTMGFLASRQNGGCQKPAGPAPAVCPGTSTILAKEMAKDSEHNKIHLASPPPRAHSCSTCH